MADDFYRCVVDSSRLSSPLMSLPQEFAGLDLSIVEGSGNQIAVTFRIVPYCPLGQRQPQAEQRLIGVPDVRDLQRREVGPAPCLLVLPDGHEHLRELRIAEFHPL